ncbi:membrane protein insertion efficiency factor YidD [Candidatus Peregrinibacteria bacterium]|nr:MAG: membrane protein insertion efficiency factor YidD [Candidatus Peregrinibacteria bacterium]
MNRFALFLIRWYQQAFSPDHAHKQSFCQFVPSCSEYAKQSFEKYSFFTALYKTSSRILRCHPWSKGGKDLP